ncbi:MAG: hypothetical protein ACYTG0_33535, partial [Planctomycetota bacterium]
MAPDAKHRIAPRWIGLMLPLCGFAAAGLSWAGETLEERRARIEQMTSAEKEELRRRLERFDDLSEKEKNRLRQLHEAIESHARSEELRAVMHRYYEWIKTISPAEREELRRLSPEERIKGIIDARQKQEARRKQ